MPDYLSGILPSNPLRAMGIKVPRKRKQTVAPNEDEQQSLISSLGHTTMGGLQTVGNILDVPGGMVRNLITGHNPLTPLLHPISGEGRVSGEDILDNLGIKHENDASKWEVGDVAHPVGGFGVELALDPLTYLTFGGSALTKLGKAAKAGGKLTRGLRKGIEAGERGLVGVGLPFRHPSFVLGTGERAKQIAGGIDKATAAIAGTKPVRALRAAFDSSVKGLHSRAFQEHIPDALHALDAEDLADIRMKTGRWANILHKAASDTFDPHNAEQARSIFEGIHPPPTAEIGQVVKEFRDEHANIIQRAKELGIPASELKDAFAEYVPAYLSQAGGGVPGKGTASIFSANEPSQHARRAYLKDIPGGRAAIMRLGKDQALRGLIDKGDEAGIIANLAKNPEIPATYTKTVGKGAAAKTVTGDRHKALARFLLKQPKEVLDSGIFGNHPLQDILTRVTRGSQRARAVSAMLDVVAKHVKDNPLLRNPGARAAEGTVRMAGVMKQLGLKAGDSNGGWLKQMADRMGLPAQHVDDPAFRKAFGKMRVTQEVADDMLRMFDRFKPPPSASPLLKGIDTITNLFKAGVTSPFPSFHVRNRASGFIQNMLHGMVGQGSEKAARDMLAGKTVKGAASIPEVAAHLQHYGMPLTDDAGTEVLRQMVYAHGLGGKFAGEVAQRTGTHAAGSTLHDILDEMPGAQGPLDWKHVARQFAGRTSDTTLNPTKATIRGVMGAPETTFGPIKAGESIGAAVEHSNRVAPFINQLKKGVASKEAARRVLDAQVDYSPQAFTAFERDVMKRLLPFYSFQKGITKNVARTLAEKPGGALAQTIRATGNASHSDGPLPDYVTQSTPIPLGESEDGTKRFITGLGLMHESPLGYFSGNPLSELGSQLNPLVKMPIEHATGHSMFQSGRSLDELDPVLGRTLANLTGREDAIRTPRLLEELISNSPLARLGTTLRTATDSRKDWKAKAANLLSGVRVSDISPGAQDAVALNALKEAMRKRGGRTFEDVYIPEDKIARMSPQRQEEVRAFQALQKFFNKRAKTRKLKKQKEGR